MSTPSYILNFDDDDHDGSCGGRLQALWRREKKLIVALVLLCILSNIPYAHYILYPLVIFSTWVHEMCHGIAAILVGGEIVLIEIYANTGGWVRWTNVRNEGDSDRWASWKKGFILSAGYTGSAIVGFAMLLTRRLKRAPQIWFITLGVLILLSCILWIQNAFGLQMMIPFGIILIVMGILLKGRGLGTLYAFLACVLCLQSIMCLHDQFFDADFWDGDDENNSWDATYVTASLGGTYFLWTFLWYVQSVILLVIGFLFPFKPRTRNEGDGLLVCGNDTTVTSGSGSGSGSIAYASDSGREGGGRRGKPSSGNSGAAYSPSYGYSRTSDNSTDQHHYTLQPRDYAYASPQPSSSHHEPTSSKRNDKSKRVSRTNVPEIEATVF